MADTATRELGQRQQGLVTGALCAGVPRTTPSGHLSIAEWSNPSTRRAFARFHTTQTTQRRRSEVEFQIVTPGRNQKIQEQIHGIEIVLIDQGTKVGLQCGPTELSDEQAPIMQVWLNTVATPSTDTTLRAYLEVSRFLRLGDSRLFRHDSKFLLRGQPYGS